MRIVVARCRVSYRGRLEASLDEAVRVIIRKADGSVLIHSDDGSYKPKMWMSPPCRVVEADGVWTVTHGKTGEVLTVEVAEVLHDHRVDLGVDPGLVKDGVERQLQALLAEQVQLIGPDVVLVQREYMTPVGPVDLLCRDRTGAIAVEVKRRGEIDGVEQLTRYLTFLHRDPLLRPVRGVFAAQEIRPQARTLAADRGIECLTLDYDALRGAEPANPTLF